MNRFWQSCLIKEIEDATGRRASQTQMLLRPQPIPKLIEAADADVTARNET